jgi:tetratricopeptide (TPR) repeat protein
MYEKRIECERFDLWLLEADTELETLDAMISFGSGDAARVISSLAPAAAAGDTRGVPRRPLQLWLVARAFEELRQPDSAARYFDIVAEPARMDWYGRNTRGIVFPVAHFRLGDLYTQLEQFDRAEEHYLTFLETFTHPDPEYVWMVTAAREALQDLARGR